jgi:hypothetical protein
MAILSSAALDRESTMGFPELGGVEGAELVNLAANARRDPIGEARNPWLEAFRDSSQHVVEQICTHLREAIPTRCGSRPVRIVPPAIAAADAAGYRP